ncbi:hypothetical protein [Luteipulveratus mongoliensis]|uniref:Uncharacterized protein n=1 Tax=Luteipulveratus mongoliensis TaxID=571913 RepID=A0A0K1JFJ6_9MICO|nr:hypothetical protein [Luteipulveratus mongoliensis]AKU15353.1 hypothetical protein VV02_04855 [Luteipulveratus mongoliensis]
MTRTAVRRLAAVGLIAVLAVVGWSTYRWWTGDAHRTQQFVANVQSLPGVDAAWTDHEEGIERVAMAPASSEDQVRGVVRRLQDRYAETREHSTITVGVARAVISQARSFAGDETPALLHAVGSVDVQPGTTIDVPTDSAGPVDVRVPTAGTSVSTARTVLTALAAADSWPMSGSRLWVRGPRGGVVVPDEVSISGARESQDLLSRLARLELLQRWHPSVRFGSDPRDTDITVYPSGLAEVGPAMSQARSLADPGSMISATVGRDDEDSTTISGTSDPARAVALVRQVSVGETVVRYADTGLLSVELRTSYDQLPGVLASAGKAGVRTIHVTWDDGEIKASVAQARQLLPGVARLRSLGYTTVWVAPDAGGTLRIGVAPIGSTREEREKASSDLEGRPDGLTQLSRAVRELGWPGRAEVHIPVVMDERLRDQIFLSTATGRSVRAPRAPIPATGVIEAWDATATPLVE